MQTPFTRKPGMDKQTRQPYQLFVDTDEAIQNRYLRMEQSTLSCSCTSDQSVDECRHIKERHLEFIRWKRAALQRLRMKLTAGQPAAVIAQRITTKFGIPMDMTQVIVSDEGTLKLQGDPGISKRYSETCGWGFMGSRVYETPDRRQIDLGPKNGSPINMCPGHKTCKKYNRF